AYLPKLLLQVILGFNCATGVCSIAVLGFTGTLSNTLNSLPQVTVEVGHEAVLSCPNLSMVSLLLMTWKKNCSSCCLLSYRSDQKMIQKVNCSERIMWKYSDPALHIYPVDLEDEGNYTCEIANSEGNFNFFSSLTVIVPPTVTLIPDQSRVAVCQASAAKPAADISWIPASNQSTEEEFHHPNGTVTRVSYFGWANNTSPSVTCLVTHPKISLGHVCLVELFLRTKGMLDVLEVYSSRISRKKCSYHQRISLKARRREVSID
uniref:Ig-like domain-containing protein n=1 Tax=Malurus cyaneus samueli TaxID=2593467 RepID=A0A8C5T3A1_9PASS